MKKVTYFIKRDKTQESLGSVRTSSRLEAAKYFAKQKKLALKQFLRIFSISK